MRKTVSLFMALIFLSHCSYLHHTVKQSGYRYKFKKNHLNADLKHLVTSNTFFIYGHLTGEEAPAKNIAMAVAAMTATNIKDLVDISHHVRRDSFYGLNLPEGSYQLVVLADINQDAIFQASEIIAFKSLNVNENDFPDRVGKLDIPLENGTSFPSPPAFSIAVKRIETTKSESLFYPKGTIRALSDPIFSKANASMGIYAPATFLENAPMMFYALEEELSYKIPVIFVHGMGGSPTEFSAIIDQLDRDRFKPWFFYYPSGADLDVLAKLFYQIFLSGQVIKSRGFSPTVVVAHSMGGLLVRRAINYYKGSKKENELGLFVSIATPFAGIPKAGLGVRKAPMVLPSWFDLNPTGPFLATLYSKKFPPFLTHHLVYTSLAPPPQPKSASDGVIPISSQLHQPALMAASAIHPYIQSHAGILEDRPFISFLHGLISQQKSPFPPNHMQLLLARGFDVLLPTNYTDKERYTIRYFGRYMQGLDHGTIEPIFDFQELFIQVAHGQVPASTSTQKTWLKFKHDFPQLAQKKPTL